MRDLSGYEPIPLGRWRCWQQLAVRLYCLRCCRLATDLTRQVLNVPEEDLPFRPCVEIAWRLAFDYWGKGYATEAAKVALRFGFVDLGLDEIVAFTAAANRRSQRVMQKLGMVSAGTGFEHPALDPGHPLRPHVLYKIANQNKS